MKNYRIILQKDPSSKICELAIELSQALALFSKSINFPLVTDSSSPQKDMISLYLEEGEAYFESQVDSYRISIPKEESIRRAFVRILDAVFHVDIKDGKAAEKSHKETPLLHSLYSQGIFKKRDYNRVFQGTSLAIEKPEELNLVTTQVLSSVVARIAMDNESIVYPALRTKEDAKLVINESTMTSLSRDNNRLLLSYNPLQLGDLYRLLKLPDFLEMDHYLQGAINLENFDGQLAYALTKGQEGDQFYLEKISKERRDLLPLEGLNLSSYKDEHLVFEEETSFSWEVDRFKELFLSALPRLKNKKNLQIQAALSEDQETRKELILTLQQLLLEQGIDAEIKLYNSFKQGFSWCTEEVLEKAKGKDLERIILGFSEFLKDPSEPWNSESGAVPSYVNMNLDNEGKWFDMPIRLLQELYPADDLLAKELGIDRDLIEFECIEHSPTPLYEAQLFLKDGTTELYSYSPVFSERPYLDEFPSMGLVHPATAYLRILSGEEELFFETLKTDLEQIWDYYQSTILPKVKDYLHSFHEPIFSTLNMEIWLSEVDIVLPCRQDQLSAMDSFHEDLYFVGLDYFKLLGQQRFGKPIDAPGLILPVLHSHRGAPKIKWSIALPKGTKAFYTRNDQLYPIEKASFTTELDKLFVEGVLLKAQYKTDCKDKELVEKLKELIEADTSFLPQAARSLDSLEISMGEETIALEIPQQKKNKTLSSFAYTTHEIYGYQEYHSSIEELKATKGIEVQSICTSYEGRDIHNVEYVDDGPGFTTSYKKTLQKPTLFIKARHHANEVSSTNSTFALIKLLRTDPRYKEALERLNFVFMPCQNPDGTALHYELQKEHPLWIYHISRFNALGKEFGNEYFKPDTIHTEALALEKTFERWLPDLYIDDHGVPSHEWCQQFSGYTAPAYKGFWLPRALLYGYFWYPKGEAHKDNVALAQELQEITAERIGSIAEFNELNHDLKDRFSKYANAWMPKMFPAEYYKDLIFYWIPFDVDPNHRYLSIRYPEITTVAYTSEVADETAQGDYLELCVKAHLENNLAIIEHMTKRQVDFHREMTLSPEEIFIVNKRKRK